ncbi:hypothetical protein PL75_09645 [Neisseria arctica]|uniref:Uncharacterized protein n=1 Tax=Neisseria arctica TaxID=1470200 RepID=A0A0J0YPU4_9NEIS|nr:hypothetical protein PL75_09645 [Neisseria arctica]
MYAKAQVSLGLALIQKGDTEGEITAYQKVRQEDSKEAYAKAQFNLGIALTQKGDTDGAITAYQKVRQEDSKEEYSKAQVNLGLALEQKGDTEGAITAYQKVRQEDFPELYAIAQFNLGLALTQKGDADRAIQALEKSKNLFYYEAKAMIQVLDSKLTDPAKSHFKNILDFIRKLLGLLQIKGEATSEESKVAHYTRPGIAWNVLNNLDNAKPSHFRLNTIKNVNDPMEGLVFYQYLRNQDCINTEIYQQLDNFQESVFISCFTFNHDSLNQFRLYGKEQGLEASGVSLVLKQTFFDKDSNVNRVKFIASQATNTSILNTIPLQENNEDKPAKKNTSSYLPKQALYRCIYLEPESGYLALAHRDKVTFYREHYSNSDTSEKSTKAWQDYQEKIQEMEKQVGDLLKEIKEEVKALQDEADIKDKPSNLQKATEILAFILQPMQYLIKHSAFEEEQECRMIYITSLSDDKIRINWENSQMYVEYEPDVKTHLDKMYLSPGARNHEDFFRKILEDKAKVCISHNPFRGKA